MIDLATGKALKFRSRGRKGNVRSGLGGSDTRRLAVSEGVPGGNLFQNREARIRILRAYEDAASYGGQGDRIVFDRPLGIKRNVW